MLIMAKKQAKPASFSDQVRTAIETSGLSRYRLAQLSGVEQAVLSRFMAGKRGIGTSTLDKLAVVLNLELVMHGPKDSPETKGK